ncbi:MAG: hypothetical protein ACAI43_13175 [Phycisphaerae bacterium]|nr:hypothetical protein [Tepidisphaeraceae bacterium]
MISAKNRADPRWLLEQLKARPASRKVIFDADAIALTLCGAIAETNNQDVINAARRLHDGQYQTNLPDPAPAKE